MKQTITPDVLRRAVRDKVCSHCDRCAVGFETAPPGVARPCEGECPLFATLPMLWRIASSADPMLVSSNRPLTDAISRVADAQPSAPAAAIRSNQQRLARVLHELAGR